MKSNDIKILIKSYNENLAKRQPWYTIKALSNILIENNFNINIISSENDIEQNFQGLLIKVWSFKDLISSKKKTNYKLAYLITFPFYNTSNLSSLKLSDFFTNWRGLYKIIFVAFLPNFFLKKKLGKADIVITISDRSNSFLKKYVKTIKFIPFLFNNWDGAKYNNYLKTSKRITLGYFGSPITTRGFSDLLNFFNYASDKYNDFELKLLTRIERKSLKNAEENYLKLFNKNDNIIVISGFLDRVKLAKELQDIDFLILPFKIVLSELPIVVLEALEFGIPLITTKESGIENLISKKNQKDVLFIDSLEKSNYPKVLNFIKNHNSKIDFSIVEKSIKKINNEFIKKVNIRCQN